MRILLAHDRYQITGGEETQFDSEASLLEQHGHTVIKFTEDNQRIRNMNPVHLAVSAIWSRNANRRLNRILQETKPDIAHFHNIFPLFSPSVYSACRDNGVPVIQALHNYRLLCPAATFLRSGRVCEDCLGKTPPWPSILHSCYRNSRAQTTIVAAMITVHRWRNTWKRNVDRFITPSAFTREKFLEAGFPRQRISVCPGLFELIPQKEKTKRRSAVYIGRLSVEKGFAFLFEAWQHIGGIPLKVIGDGPLFPGAKRAAPPRPHPDIEFLGWKDHPALAGYLAQARFLVYPSLFYETFGISIAEAYSCGVPVIASRLGALAEIVEDGRTGLLFRPGDPEDLGAKVQWAWTHPREMEAMGREARRVFDRKYSQTTHYAILLSAYETTIRSHTARTP
jgi:glycosyltransferase involved in cell wall biosynthesis